MKNSEKIEELSNMIDGLIRCCENQKSMIDNLETVVNTLQTRIEEIEETLEEEDEYEDEEDEDDDYKCINTSRLTINILS